MEPLLFCDHALLHRDRFEIARGHQPENALFIVETGSFSCRFSSGAPMTAGPGDFVFFPQTESFARSVVAPADFHLIYFRQNADDPLCRQLPRGVVAFADVERKRSNHAIFQAMVNRTDDFAIRMRQHALNDVFFQYLLEAAPVGPVPRKVDAPLQRALQYFENHIAKPVSLQAAAAHAGCSPAALNRRFKAETGMPPIRYLLLLRMRTAKRLLRETDKRVSDIAALCGYENIYYFSNAFQKECGCSPSAYRKRLPRV